MKTICAVLMLVICNLAAGQNKLEVDISGISNDKGNVRVGLYNSDGSFLSQTFKSLLGKIESGKSTVVFENLPAGNYAISAYHDENSNGTLDKNAFGFPSEDYACSNNAKAMMGPPKWEDAKFVVAADSKINLIFNN